MPRYQDIADYLNVQCPSNLLFFSQAPHPKPTPSEASKRLSHRFCLGRNPETKYLYSNGVKLTEMMALNPQHFEYLVDNFEAIKNDPKYTSWITGGSVLKFFNLTAEEKSEFTKFCAEQNEYYFDQCHKAFSLGLMSLCLVFLMLYAFVSLALMLKIAEKNPTLLLLGL